MKKVVLFILYLIVSLKINAQNLVKNSSFELTDKYGQVSDWRLKGFITGFITDENCGCLCNGKDLTYHSCKTLASQIGGCSSVMMLYLPNCNNNGNTVKYEGCSTYVYQKMDKPLSIGDTFKVSFWIYIPSKYYPSKGSEATKHIGVLMMNKQIYPQNETSIIKKNVLSISPDSITLDKWLKLETFIVPTCELSYVTIGVFKEPNWQLIKPLEDNKLIYFLDKISIEKSILPSNKPSNFTYYCNEANKSDESENSTTIDLNIKFDYGSDVFNTTATLDSFAQFAIKNPNHIFYLSGHTDNTGFNNLDLSKRRVENVANYLKSRYKLPNYRLITGYFGDKKNISNETAENRKVNIKTSLIPKPNACYREALKNVKEGNWDNAFNMLNCWVTNEIDDEKILIFFDPQLDTLKKDGRWKFIETQVRKVYKKYINAAYSFSLDSLYATDQKYRRLASVVNDLAGYNAEIDTARWEYPKISDKEEHERDSLIYQHLKSLINQYGYPKQEEVGNRSAKAAAVIIIHSHDTVTLKKYLPILESYCRVGDGDWGYYAAMYDKLCTLQNIPQKYGTQFVTDPNDPNFLIRYKFESKAVLNEWRKKIALPLLNDDDFNIKIKAN